MKQKVKGFSEEYDFDYLEDQHRYLRKYMVCQAWSKDQIALLDNLYKHAQINSAARSKPKNEDESFRADLLVMPKIADLVDKFLTWELPKSVCSDTCVTTRDYPHSRTGTNLLTADEAKQMFEYLLSNFSA